MSAVPPASHPHHEDDPAAPPLRTWATFISPQGGGSRRPLPLCSALSEQELKPKVCFNSSL